MELHVVIAGDKDLSGQLYRQLRDAIRSGRLAPGEQLPPSRLLAAQLWISRKTVSEVYARLGLERLLGRVGSGTFVAPQAPAPVTPGPARALASHKHLVDWHTPTQTQVALARFMGDGDLQRHIRRCHATYAQRRERLRARFADDLAPWAPRQGLLLGFGAIATADIDPALDRVRDVLQQMR
jgi:DNA-binding transcriptional MocR family regulator